MASDQPMVGCPFCAFSDNDSYFLLLHIETLHSEGAGQSPFLVLEDQAPSLIQSECPDQAGTAALDVVHRYSSITEHDDNLDQYVECSEPNCGESIHLRDLNIHSDMHLAEHMTAEGGVMGEWKFSSKSANSTDSSSTRRRLTKTPDTIHGHPEIFEDDNVNDDDENYCDPKHSMTSTREVGRTALQTKSCNTTSTTNYKRLGKSELGPHAYESQMPTWLLHSLLHPPTRRLTTITPQGTLQTVTHPLNETLNLLPLIAHLSSLDPTVQSTTLCHPSVRHISKFPREGGFCGYRNIQMLTSHLIDGATHAAPLFPNRRVPNILELQDAIEEAWDGGYNTSGRIETGGIRGSRKYIGTPEAQAFFLGRGIDCEALAYAREDAPGLHAWQRLLQAVEAYFATGSLSPLSTSPDKKFQTTALPPIYLQHPGHSLTIVGIETRRILRVDSKSRTSNERPISATNLLVFDPMFRPSPAITKLLDEGSGHGSGGIGGTASGWTARLGKDSARAGKKAHELLRAYRKGEGYLKRFPAFETVTLTGLGSVDSIMW